VIRQLVIGDGDPRGCHRSRKSGLCYKRAPSSTSPRRPRHCVVPLRRAAAWSGLAGGDRGGARYPLRLRDCFDYDASFGYALANIYDGETMNAVSAPLPLLIALFVWRLFLGSPRRALRQAKSSQERPDGEILFDSRRGGPASHLDPSGPAEGGVCRSLYIGRRAPATPHRDRRYDLGISLGKPGRRLVL
jgi:hypothetical protein